jgi:hypothetical protein
MFMYMETPRGTPKIRTILGLAMLALPRGTTTWKARGRRTVGPRPATGKVSLRFYLKQTESKRTDGMAPVVECLPSNVSP